VLVPTLFFLLKFSPTKMQKTHFAVQGKGPLEDMENRSPSQDAKQSGENQIAKEMTGCGIC